MTWRENNEPFDIQNLDLYKIAENHCWTGFSEVLIVIHLLM